MTIQEISDEYERELLAEQERTERYVTRQYNELMGRIAVVLASNTPKRAREWQINAIIREATLKIDLRIEKGIQNAWELSNQKQIVFLDKKLKGRTLPDNIRKVCYDPNKKALDNFTKRTRKGLTISDRVWNTVDGVNRTVEAITAEGISKGEGAPKIARRLRKELRNPTLTEARGKGVYKSPLANTKRLARTETNRSYRRSDIEGWKKSPQFLGFRIQLSATQSKKVKARCELCVKLQGVYPLEFVWDGWHPNCLCYTTPVIMTDDQFYEYMDMIEAGKDSKRAVEALRKRSGLVKKLPKEFTGWLKDNKDRVKKWTNKPYWYQDNPGMVKVR